MLVGLVMAVAGMLLLTRIDVGTAYATHVLPALLVMSVGLAGTFISAASTALYGVEPHDAGVASALLNTSQQVGGSLGLALLNTFYAAAVTGYVADHSAPGADPKQTTVLGFIHGYHVAFAWGAGLLAAAWLTAFVLITVQKDELPDPTAAAAAAV
jgi:hypothetical protein